MIAIIAVIATIVLITNLYMSRENSVVTLTFWKAFLFGVSYMEGENEETKFAVFELHLACIVITLIYDI
jgi:hypothetical protein